MCKPLRTQKFRAPRISWYSFGVICRPFQPSHLKNHEFHFFTKLPTQPSTYAVVHRQPWPCANPSELKSFVHQEFHGIHLGSFVGLATLTSQKPRISFFHKTPHPAINLCRGALPTLAMCKTIRTKNFRALRFSWYSFGDICWPFQPSHLKTTNFIFSQNSPPSNLASSRCTDLLGQVQTPSNSKLSCKDIYSTHLGTFVGFSNAHISKTTNFIFSQNSPPSHLPMPRCTANLGHVQNPRN